VNIHSAWKGRYKSPSCKAQTKIYNALLKYGYDDFEKVVLEECPKKLLNEREIYWIDYYDSVNNGYNIRKGGNGGGKYGEFSAEHKNRLSASHKGIRFTAEHRTNMSKANKGQVCTPEQRVKISASWVKRRLVDISEETRRKMSEAHRSCNLTKETRNKLSLANTKRKHSKRTKTKISNACKEYFRKIREQSQQQKEIYVS
jgi:group I intron endonuclease